jgi:hypothetical protein
MCVFVGFSRILLLGILIFKWLATRRLYKSFGVKGLKYQYSIKAYVFQWISSPSEFQLITNILKNVCHFCIRTALL